MSLLNINSGLYRSLVDQTTEYAITLIDLESNITSWNIGAERIFGYSRDEILNTPIARTFIPEDVQKGAVEQEFETARNKGQSLDERWHLRKDGSRFWASGVMTSLRNSRGDLIGYGKIVRDLTERKKIEEALRESEVRYRFLVDAATEYAIFVVDTAGIVKTWNHGAERLLGYKAHQIIGQNVSLMFTPEDIAKGDVLKEFEAARLHGISTSERWHARQDRKMFWGSGQLTALRNENGELVGYSKLIRDMTEQKERENALIKSEERYRLLVEEVRDYAIFMLDPSGRVMSWNAGAERFKQYRPDEILGKHFRTFFTAKDTERGQPELELESARREGRYHSEGWRVGKDGVRFWAEEVVTAIRDNNGNLLGFCKITRDISERKRAEEERAQLLERERASRAEAEVANRTKDEFIATLSHELRTPLQAILGWTPLLKTGRLDEQKTIRGLDAIERNARAQTQLVEDLLDISRITTGKLHLNTRPLQLAPVIEAAIDVIRTAANAKAISISTQLEPEATINGDPDRIQQIIWNLLSNAVKFTPSGGKVDVILKSVKSNALIEVKDTGRGIRPEFLPHVFEPFRQASSASTREFSGLGLGLAIVHYLVEMHGGTVTAYSAGEYRGATFTVSLPLLVSIAKPVHEQTTIPESAFERNAGKLLEGVHVMIVDDEIDALDVLVEALKESGANVTPATTALEAREKLRSEKPDVLVSDIGMPLEDGYALIRSIRSLPAEYGGSVPAIALTAFARDEDRSRALAAGYQMHVAKPVHPDVLISAIAELAGLASHA